MTLLPVELGPLGSGVGLDPYWRNSINLVPFETIQLYLESDLGRIAWANLLGNLLLARAPGRARSGGVAQARRLEAHSGGRSGHLARHRGPSVRASGSWTCSGRHARWTSTTSSSNVAGALLGYALLPARPACGGGAVGRQRTNRLAPRTLWRCCGFALLRGGVTPRLAPGLRTWRRPPRSDRVPRWGPIPGLWRPIEVRTEKHVHRTDGTDRHRAPGARSRNRRGAAPGKRNHHKHPHDR